ncbi:hypothetical protein [Streptomyces apocyni]|uniref:hypothetical protein n=1 Tax=Streptomyces apocyni TaxID=2654677 RepID=UPI0012EAC2A7|nr:hypothetical protein [Streptomyces apocyni]
MSLFPHAHTPFMAPGWPTAVWSTTPGRGRRHPLHQEQVLLGGPVTILVIVLAVLGWQAQEIAVLLATLTPLAVGYRPSRMAS